MDYFENDLQNVSRKHADLARAIYNHCADSLKAELHYRPERFKTKGKGQKQTIFWTRKTRNYFLVIDLQIRGRLFLMFPDKDNIIFSLGAKWGTDRQGEAGKREKIIDLSSNNSPNMLEEILDTVDVIHDNALEYYLRRHNSTNTWKKMFGEPLPNTAPLRALSLKEEYLQEVYGEGICSISGLNENLELGWVGDKPVLVSASHNPNQSKFLSKAKNTIPMDVRDLVWHRDGGACTAPECNSNAYIQYDHLIPRSWNGSNTEHNIVLKCRSCNLSKSGKLQV